MPEQNNERKHKDAYIVTVDMGYGHQRAVYPLQDIAACPQDWMGKSAIITANNYAGIPNSDRRRWEGGRKIYETISRMKKLPIIGKPIFGIMDYLQRIEPFYPKRDLSKPTLQVKQIYGMIRHGWGKHLIETLNSDPKPYITSFFTTAFMAEEHGYKGDIYCICTDADVSRAWVPLEPEKTRIIYFAPNRRVKKRLMLYGIDHEQIFITGFPLPKENIDGGNERTLRGDLGCRLGNLDPNGLYHDKYQHTLNHYLGKKYCNIEADHPLTIMFAVGGAGAQREIGVTILQSLHEKIDNGEVRLILVAGSRNDVYRYYTDKVQELHLQQHHGGSIQIIYDQHKLDYFGIMNEALRKTDILWTKPSEMSFYTGLGLPIIMAPPIGSQEQFNKSWLHAIGAAFEQEDPRYTNEWLYDWLKTGWLAQAAMEGFLDAPRNGTYNIEDIVLRGKTREIEDMHLL